MIISSRTPEGMPNECPVCQKTLCIEPSSPVGDAPCPHCGSLLWFVNLTSRIRVFSREEIPLTKRKLIEKLASLRLSDDSLDRVELVMELEEEFSIMIPEDELEKMKTIDDVIDFILYKLPE
jgi:acyl carrier protein